jgi:hypothetical protein
MAEDLRIEDPELEEVGDVSKLLEENDPLAEEVLVLEAERPGGLLGAFRTRGSTAAEVWVPLKDAQGRDVPSAEILVGRAKGEEYTELLGKAARKFGDRKGNLSHQVLSYLLPVLYSKSLFRGFRGFRLGPEGESAVDRVEADVWIMPTGSKRPVRRTRVVQFAVDSDGWLVDNEDNRRRLLQVFPDIQEAVWLAASDEDNFPASKGGDEKN